jgi:hypothetical protein
MHKLKVLVLGPSSFTTTLIELQQFLKFNICDKILGESNFNDNYDMLIFHKDVLSNVQKKKFIDNYSSIKILASNNVEKNTNYDLVLPLPTTIKEINSVVEKLTVKKIFNENSSIKIKQYLLDKNEKKLIKKDNFVVLTEKEIQLLELFLNRKEPLSKNIILSLVWHYSSDADTHTVETHIYRLRKKINDKFMDEKFILNNKEGYYL